MPPYLTDDLEYEEPIRRLSPFEYDSLGSTGDRTRLVKLLKPESPKNRLSRVVEQVPRVRCQLKVLYLGAGKEKYDAVSYYWGNLEDRKQTRPIELSGKEFMVSPVVEDILLRLRDEKQDRLLWIDLICINQRDADEKGLQVKRMGEIFAQAQTVIVSLGRHMSIPRNPEDPIITALDPTERIRDERRRRPDFNQRQMQSAMDTIESTWKDMRARVGMCLSSTDESNLVEFLGHAWFERIWVIQEVAVAKKLRVICGRKEVKGESFERLHGRMSDTAKGEDLKAQLKQLRPVLAYLSRSASETFPKPELLTLLQQFRPWKATNPRDKVYALMGLSRDGPEAMEANYKISVEKLYQRVARYMIQRHRSLAVLTYTGFAQRTPPLLSWVPWRIFGSVPFFATTLPSWCPDWRTPYRFSEGPEPVTTPPRSPLHHRTTITRRANIVHAIRPDCNHDSGTLSVSGYRIASISSIMDGSFVLDVPERIAGCFKAPSATYTNMSQHMSGVHQLLMNSNGGSLKKGDVLCILQGCTGVAILRPQGTKFSIVFLEHTDFERLRVDEFGELETAISGGRSVFGNIARDILSRRSQRSLGLASGSLSSMENLEIV